MRLAYFLTHPIQYQSPLIRHLLGQGVDVHVVYGPMAAAWAEDDAELGRHEPWDVPLLEGYPHEFVESPFASGLSGFLALRPRLARLLERMKPDAVWVHGWGDAWSLAAWSAAWTLGIPILLRGESHLQCLKGGALRRWLHRQVLSRCFGTVSRFLAIGSANREFYRHYGVPEERIFDVPYAVDNTRFCREDAVVLAEAAAWRGHLGIPDGGTVIGFFGKLKTAKRPDLALKAAARIAAEMPREKQPWLIFVGDGPLRGRLERLARRLFPERTRFLGFQNQSRLPALYRVMDLLLLPSQFEPWGLVVNEAMCAGRAAVVSDRVGAAHDLVFGRPQAGAVFKSGSLEDLCRALAPLVQDAGLLRQSGLTARERIVRWSFDEDARGLRAALAGLSVRVAETEKSMPRRGVVAAYLGVHQVFQMGAAAAEAGRLEHFYCSLIRFPHRWGDVLARWLFIPSASPLGSEVLPEDRVSEIPLPLLAQRFAERCMAPRKVDPLCTNRWFAQQVARRLPQHAGAGIMVGAETCSLELFTAARKLGMCCMMDCHGIPTDFLQDGINRAADELGLQAPRLLDSPAMTERKQLERELADVMVLCSELQREIYAGQGIAPEKLHVVPLWVDTEFWAPQERRTVRRGDQPLRVLFAGAGSLAKGLPYLLQALNHLGPGSAELTLVGPMQPDMRRFLNASKVTVRRMSYCSRMELRGLYWSHDVVVMPSLGDSFGFVAMEAMACGLPVVITDRCGAPVPEASWRVPAFSASAIAGRLEHYHAQPQRCLADGNLASDFARQWTSRLYRDHIKWIYEDLLAASAKMWGSEG